MPEVDAEHRDGPLGDEAQRAEHRAVAADADERVDLAREVVRGLRAAAGRVGGRGEQAAAVRARPRRDRGGDRSDVAARVQHEADRRRSLVAHRLTVTRSAIPVTISTARSSPSASQLPRAAASAS